MRCENCTLLYSTIKWPLAPAKREGYLKTLPSFRFSCHQSEEAALLRDPCIDSVDIDSIECIRDPCLVSTVLTYIVLMVWLKSP